VWRGRLGGCYFVGLMGWTFKGMTWKREGHTYGISSASLGVLGRALAA